MGSKVYIPNGVGVFDVVNISSNITLAKNSTGLYFVFMRSNGVISDAMPFSYCYSGNSQPTITHTYAIWYDTANNKIKWTNNNGSTWVDGYSLPICIVVNDTPGTQNVSSIEQIFNGFGYIGSTIFALPGVEGLIPNERDKNGSLINDAFKTENVLTHNVNGPYNGYIVLSSTTIDVWDSLYGKYDIERNVNLYNGNKSDVSIAGNISIDDTGYIISFNSKNTFQYVDRNEAEGIFGKSITINYLDD